MRWGSPGSPGGRGAGGSTRRRHVLGTWQRGEKPAGRSSWGARPGPTQPPGRIPPRLHHGLGVINRFIFLPPLFPVSLSASCEENPAWFIPLVAQILACMGLGEQGETFASSRALQIFHIKPTEKANLLPAQKS